jgi:hypothetical protein
MQFKFFIVEWKTCMISTYGWTDLSNSFFTTPKITSHVYNVYQEVRTVKESFSFINLAKILLRQQSLLVWRLGVRRAKLSREFRHMSDLTFEKKGPKMGVVLNMYIEKNCSKKSVLIISMKVSFFHLFAWLTRATPSLINQQIRGKKYDFHN